MAPFDRIDIWLIAKGLVFANWGVLVAPGQRPDAGAATERTHSKLFDLTLSAGLTGDVLSSDPDEDGRLMGIVVD